MESLYNLLTILPFRTTWSYIWNVFWCVAYKNETSRRSFTLEESLKAGTTGVLQLQRMCLPSSAVSFPGFSPFITLLYCKYIYFKNIWSGSHNIKDASHSMWFSPMHCICFCLCKRLSGIKYFFLYLKWAFSCVTTELAALLLLFPIKVNIQ